MATQGMLSIVDGERTIIKIISGCDGFNLVKLVVKIKKLKVLDPVIIRKEALKIGFGCEDCLVVMTQNRIVGPDDFDPDELKNYMVTFNDPKFNPRWKRGTCDHYIQLDVEDIMI